MQLADAQNPDKVAFVQFLMEDGAAITQLRKLNADVANIGGVHEPRMPIIREVPNAVLDGKPLRFKRAPKTLPDKPPEVNPNPISSEPNSPIAEVIQPASNSSNSSDDNPESDNDSSDPDSLEAQPALFEEGFDLEPDEMIAWTCAAAPPEAPCMHPLAEETFIITDDDEPAELEISPNIQTYVMMPNVTNPLLPDKKMHANQSCASKVVIERTHNVLTRDEALKTQSSASRQWSKNSTIGINTGHGAACHCPRAQIYQRVSGY